MGNKMKYKDLSLAESKILVISNNAFSETNNNGKTLASFFENFHPDNISQLYFSADVPNGTSVDNFYQISDKDIIKSIFNKNYQCGRKICKSQNNTTSESKEGTCRLTEIIKGSNIARLIREVFWKFGGWKSKDLQRWLSEISPDIIFFCAGDSGFSYNITKYIQKKFHSKLALYITDDYVLPRKTFNIVWWIRRDFICLKMKTAVTSCDLFVTISTKMQEVYKEFFGKDSFVAVNMTQSMRDESREGVPNDCITFVYAGGFHYNRFKILGLLAESIKKYNSNFNNKKKACLKIFSNQKPDISILKKIVIAGASEYCGYLNLKELKKVLSMCDIPVHVESFDKRSIESTRLSVSTKIPEYLSLGKPVLAIGPKEVASMEYLRDTAYCITDPGIIYFDLINLIANVEMQSNLSRSALEKYYNNHRIDIVSDKFKKNILDMM